MLNLFKKFEYINNSTIEGLTNELSIFYVLEYFKRNNKNTLIVTSSLYEANKFYNELSFYSNKVLLFPMDDFVASVALTTSPELQMKRLETLEQIQNDAYIIITNLNGYLKKIANKSTYQYSKRSLKIGDIINRRELESLLTDFGYKKESLITSTGEYGIRGFVIDIYNIRDEHPIRIELFGDEIESIRYFDEETQLSLNEIKSVDIKPFTEIKTDISSSLADYISDSIVFFIDKSQIDAAYKKLIEDVTEYKKIDESVDYSEQYFEMKDFNHNFININLFLNTVQDQAKLIRYKSEKLENFNSDFSLFQSFVKKKIKDYTIILCLPKQKQIDEITHMFEGNVNLDSIKENQINILKYNILTGFIFDSYIIIGDKNLEKGSNPSIKYKNDIKIGRKIKNIDSLNAGDYVVHRAHGIGIYQGVVTLAQRNIKKDYLQINYHGSDKVFIPVEKISSIFKYSDKDGMKPKIDKLNGTSWSLRKRAIQNKIKDISEELIKLYAKRNSIEAPSYMDYDLEFDFAKTFQYELTRDQERSIHDINRNLKSKVPMDRLLCGDVGFGKTEVAFRAMFKTVVNNYQVFYLCPTTILSKQQYESALDRFKDFPVEIALLNRFTTKKEAKYIIERLKAGKIDMIFGTHRLLSDDISFKKLGLLVVDEEQRFGVTHKEKLKKYKNDVNVLTLSATPIPRTLKMSLSGLRDLSIIDTAPVNRYPVQTYVLQENDFIIKDAIYKELTRKGQAFILYNNIAHIEERMFRIKMLVPEARIRFAHGRMTKSELESIMADFIAYEFDILLCTTIIETGIDIANANTLIIYDADHFGLSQLYQLRGRVGRSDRIAYAYFMYNKTKMLNDVAIKRLQAIKDFTELGSGYKIAMRDLSIRGAGDILGSEQAGFVDSVGISLYIKMIEEEMMRQKGIEVKEEEDTKSLINVQTHIDNNYVQDEELKIEIHQKINEINNYNQLLDVKAEIEDRFGLIPEEIIIYMYEEWFENIAFKLHINKVIQTENNITIELPEELSNQIKGDKLFMEAYSVNSNFQLRYLNRKIQISLPLKKLDKHFVYYVVPLFDLILNDLS